jgi:hypothetical protein
VQAVDDKVSTQAAVPISHYFEPGVADEHFEHDI